MVLHRGEARKIWLLFSTHPKAVKMGHCFNMNHQITRGLDYIQLMCLKMFFKLIQVIFICGPERVPNGILLVGMGKYTSHYSYFSSLFLFLNRQQVKFTNIHACTYTLEYFNFSHIANFQLIPCSFKYAV